MAKISLMGTTFVLSKNKTVIVLEDDLRIGRQFFTIHEYMFTKI